MIHTQSIYSQCHCHTLWMDHITAQLSRHGLLVTSCLVTDPYVPRSLCDRM